MYQKQLILNKLKLPIELCDIIKSFSFYDMKTAEKNKICKENKKNLLHQIKNNVVCGSVKNYWGCYLSNNKFGQNKESDDEDSYENSICSGENCVQCGNYLNISEYNRYIFDLLPDKIICKCKNKK